MSDSVWPHRRHPTRLPHPWDSTGKYTGVGCHFLLQCMKLKVKLLSRVQLLATPWTAAYQAPPSMGFSRQKYWSGVPLPSPMNLHGPLWMFIGRTDVETEAPIYWPPDVKTLLILTDPDAGKDWRWEEKGTTEDEMVGWHHRLNGHEFE